MDNRATPASQEALEKLEKLQKSEKPEDLHALVEELEQHHFFTNENLETVEAQIAVREKIDDLLANLKIINNEAVHSRLKNLYGKLNKSIEYKTKENEAKREKHLEWAMERAFAYVEQGKLKMAIDSMVADLNKDFSRSKEERHMTIGLGMALKDDPQLNEQMVIEFIEGFDVYGKLKPYASRQHPKPTPTSAPAPSAPAPSATQPSAPTPGAPTASPSQAPTPQAGPAAPSVISAMPPAVPVNPPAPASAPANAPTPTIQTPSAGPTTTGSAATPPSTPSNTSASGPRSGPPKGPKAKKLKASPAEALLREALVNPDDLSRDSKDPVIRAIIKQIKGLNQTNLTALTLSLSSSEKIPTPSQIKKVADVKAEGINTTEVLENKIVELEEKLELLEEEITGKEIKFKEYKEIVHGKKQNASQTVEKAFDTLNSELATKNTEKLKLKSSLKKYKEVQPLMSGNKMSPRQLLLKIIEAKNPGQNKNLQSLGGKADSLVANEEEKMSPANREWFGGWKQLDKYSQFIKPSLKATLTEFAKIEQLEGMKPETLEELMKLRDNPDGLSAWIEKLKEKGKTVVPALMAYLQVAIVEGKLNVVSRGQAVDLMKGLRTVRNKRILKKINSELLNAKPQVRMQAYLSEMNEWDEKSVQVNREIIDDLVQRSYASKLSKLAVGGVALGVGLPALSGAATFLGLSPITLSGILSTLGWANVGLVGAHLSLSKGVKTFTPEYENWYRQIGPRIVGLGILGPVGLAAPELMKGLKFMFTKRKEIGQGAAKTGAAVATGAGVAWAITSFTGKVLAFPFKKIFGRKSKNEVEPKAKPKLRIAPKETETEPIIESDEVESKAKPKLRIVPKPKAEPEQDDEPMQKAA